MSSMDPWDALTCLAIHAGATVNLTSDDEGATSMTIESEDDKVVEAFQSLATALGGERVGGNA